MANGLGGVIDRFQLGRQQRFQQEQRGLQQQQQRLGAVGAQDTARLQSISQGAQQLKQIRDPQQKIAFLQQRQEQLRQAGIGTQDTEQALALAQAGRFDELEIITDQAISLGQQVKPEAPFTLSPGQVRFGPGGEQVAAVPKPEAPKDIQPQVNFLRSSINKNLTDFRKVEDSFKRIQSVTKNPSAAGDLALIFNFMKLLDPGSVVRESEFRTAEQARAWLSRTEESGIVVPTAVRSFINKAQTGQRLLDDQRNDFILQAENLFNAQRQSADTQIENFLQQADQDLISRKRVLGGKRLEAFEKRQEEQQALPQAAPQQAQRQGGQIMIDAQGNRARVFPDGTFEELP